MKLFSRAAFGTACLAIVAAHAAPAFAADGNVIPRPAPVLPFASSTISTTATLGTWVDQAAPTIAQQLATTTLPPITPAQPATPVKPAAAPASLNDLVISFVDRHDQDAEQLCLANAVYFEARSEPLEGQLAVAEVVLNRAASGIFPTGICDVVTQRAQFSFVRNGKLPDADKGSACWHRALAIADIARKRSLAGEIASDVLWYHATYVSPSWDRQRTRIAQIGKHIFFS